MGDWIVKWLAFLIVLAPALSLPAAGDEKPKDEVKIGKPMPDFALPDQDGKQWKLSERKGKKAVVICLSSTMCECGQAAVVDLQKVHEKYQKRGLEIVHVNTEPERDKWDPGFLKKFATEKEISYPLLLDKEGKVLTMLPLLGMPTLFLLDAHGVLREILKGHPDDFVQRVSARVEPLLPKAAENESEEARSHGS